MALLRAGSRGNQSVETPAALAPAIRRGRHGPNLHRVVLRGGDGRLLESEPAGDDLPEAWFTEEDGLILPADFVADDSGKD